MFTFLFEQPHRLLILTCASIFLMVAVAAGTVALMAENDLDTAHLARLAAEAALEPATTGSIAIGTEISTSTE